MQKWYVIQTKSTQEPTAAWQLRNQNFNVFNPVFLQFSRSKRTGDRVRKVLPLFPSYIFVEFDIESDQRWKSINGTRGVVGLVGCGENTVSAIPQGYVEALIARVNKDGFIKLDDATEETIKFIPDMQLKIRGDSYEGLVGTYCNHSEKRVTLLLTLLNRKIKVILPLDAVQPHKSE